MVVSFSDMIPLWNRIRGICNSKQMRRYKAPFSPSDAVVSETTSEISEVILLNVTHLHICAAAMKNSLTMKICFNPMTFQEMKFKYFSSELYFLEVNFLQISLRHIKKVNYSYSWITVIYHTSYSANLLMVNIIKRFMP